MRLIHVVGWTGELVVRAEVLVQSVTTGCPLPALDWSFVLSPLLHSNVCGQFDAWHIDCK